MKIRKLLIIPICIATCLLMSGCSSRDISRLIRIGKNLKNISEKNNDTIYEEEEVISLSDGDKKVLSNIFESAIAGNIMYTNTELNEFISMFIYQDDVFNFDKGQKSECGMNAVTPELAIDIVYDALGIKPTKKDFKLNQYGNIDIASDEGERVEFYISKAVKISEDEYRIYANSAKYPLEGVYFNGCYEFSVKKNDNSMFGYTVIGARYCDVDVWMPEKITASSVLQSEGETSYNPQNLMDNSLSTAWAEGIDGIGIGEYVLFESTGTRKVYGAFIDNGYLESTDLLNKNGSIKRIRFEFSDGSIVESDLNPIINADNYNSPNTLYTDYVDFGKEIETSSIKMSILDASSGSTYENTCVSEIKFITY